MWKWYPFSSLLNWNVHCTLHNTAVHSNLKILLIVSFFNIWGSGWVSGASLWSSLLMSNDCIRTVKREVICCREGEARREQSRTHLLGFNVLPPSRWLVLSVLTISWKLRRVLERNQVAISSSMQFTIQSNFPVFFEQKVCSSQLNVLLISVEKIYHLICE